MIVSAKVACLISVVSRCTPHIAGYAERTLYQDSPFFTSRPNLRHCMSSDGAQRRALSGQTGERKIVYFSSQHRTYNQ